MRHVVDIYRPRTAQGARGQNVGGEDLLLKGIPCSVKDVSGRESEQARRLYADATLVVEMYGDPNKLVAATDVLLLNGRRLNVGHVADKNQNGLELTLLCGEAR